MRKLKIGAPLLTVRVIFKNMGVALPQGEEIRTFDESGRLLKIEDSWYHVVKNDFIFRSFG